ncbi:hypothetical protein GOP47_0008329 [Adiantum capillus-veneris]|uniref:Germin-like protein n=1 Tax=Adiantum capillus-veneris TaxID=13818 RepID=A0A9D4UYC4_ADICA|nr:hypothetical protein GOP47_0008329 [Adiantum capillus-veneris]
MLRARVSLSGIVSDKAKDVAASRGLSRNAEGSAMDALLGRRRGPPAKLLRGPQLRRAARAPAYPQRPSLQAFRRRAVLRHLFSQQLRNLANFTGNLGSAINLAAAATFGALNMQGLSIARVDYKPRGINPPHVHPRATEVLFLAKGTLLVGFLSTAPANQFFYQTIYAGDLFVFPSGLVHFQFNRNKSKPALAIAALNSQNPGASQLAVVLFGSDAPLPEEVLETTLGIDDDEVRRLISVQNTLN